MSRDLDEENYYISNGGKIPVKWTAPQVQFYLKFEEEVVYTYVHMTLYIHAERSCTHV